VPRSIRRWHEQLLASGRHPARGWQLRWLRSRARSPGPLPRSPTWRRRPLPPGQCRIERELAAPAAAAAPLPRHPSPKPPSAELTSGPHLRGVVFVAVALLWLATQEWAPQLAILPVALLCTASTSALWCMPHEVVVSLGPVPVCFFRRRILYKNIASITIVQGRLRVLTAIACRGVRFWRPFGFVYGLTLGKAVVDIVLRADPVSGLQPAEHPLLLSVDDAEDVVAYVLFRQQHGPEAPLPTSLLACQPAGRATWIWCDLLDLLLRWHARNQTACDVCGLFLQPFQNDAWGTHARVA